MRQDAGTLDVDDPLVSFESFPGFERVLPGIKDSEVLKRQVGFKGKDRHAADVKGDGEACNQAFSIKCGLTQGVFNVVCPHVVTLGFRCLFRAESVGVALSIVLERFPQLPKVVFYDFACKLDKNALRRVRPILRSHGVRCILDRPHSITHTCSPIYMPDEILGSAAGVATQAAEVSHSIAIANRTSLANMAPTTYMTHKMVQVLMMNICKLHRLASGNVAGENDHVSLAPFFDDKIARECQRGSGCGRQATASEATLLPEAAGLGPLAASGELFFGAAAPAACDEADAATAVSPVAKARDDQDVGGAFATRQDGQDPASPDALVDSHGGSNAEDQGGMQFAPLSPSSLADEHTARLDALVAHRQPAAVVRDRNKANIKLTVFDYERLEGVKWLNDAVMNSVISLINHRARVVRDACERRSSTSDGRQLSDVPRTFMFNTFIFGRLHERAGCYDYAGVRT